MTCLLCGCAEWHFRSSLDRYVWIHGMICAYMKPWAEGILVRIDNMAFRARIAMRGLLLAGQSRNANIHPSWTQHVCSSLKSTQCLLRTEAEGAVPRTKSLVCLSIYRGAHISAVSRLPFKF